MNDWLYSVWNCTQESWATTTNFSTELEAKRLLTVIIKKSPDKYEVRERPFGTMKELPYII